jgi:hypothetical protein
MTDEAVEPLAPQDPRDAGALAAFAREHGCAWVRGVLSPAPVLAARARVLELCAVRGWLDADAPTGVGVARAGVRTPAYDDPSYIAFAAEALVLPELDALRRDPAITAALTAVLGAPAVHGRGDVVRAVFPGSAEATPAHQDAAYVRDPDVWTAWIPLGDCPRVLGVLAVAPGTHRGGLLPHNARARGSALPEGVPLPPGARWHAADLSTGDVLLVNSLTLHRALPNTSGRVRLSVDFRYGAA